MKWIRILVFAILISILIPSGIVYAASPSVDDVKVFTSYYETGDWLIVATYNISGGNIADCTNTSCFRYPSYTWYIQFIDNSDSSVKAQYTLEQEGMRPFGMSINATQATALTWEGNYSVKILGYYGAMPNSSKTLSAIDWRGEVSAGELDNWVLQQAQIMEDFDGNDYVTTVPPPYNEVLTIDGGSLFDRGIAYLSTYRPDIFQITSYLFPLGYSATTGDTNYADTLYDNWDTTLGPEIAPSLTAIAPYFGFSGVDAGRMVGALLTLMGFLAFALIEKSIAFMIILGGVMIGVFPMATVIFLVFIMAVVLIRSLFWSST